MLIRLLKMPGIHLKRKVFSYGIEIGPYGIVLFPTIFTAIFLLWRLTCTFNFAFTPRPVLVANLAHWPQVDAVSTTKSPSSLIQPYTIPRFCSKYQYANGTWPLNWEHNMSSVETSVKLMTVETRAALQRDIAGERLNLAEINLVREYRSGQSIMPKPDSVCDEDCRSLRKLFSEWPVDKPKAVIHFLIAAERWRELKDALHRLDIYFNNQFKYPVILFTDDYNLTTPRIREYLRKMTTSRVFIQDVLFQFPSYVRQSEVPEFVCIGGMGYRHMCRFNALQVYEQPILNDVKYAWRLDTDSKILRPIKYDVFQFMKYYNLTYGYIFQQEDGCELQMEPLWKVTCKYVSNEYLRTEFFHNWEPLKIFYNNFEISSLSVWRSGTYRSYTDYIDRLGGIYYYRWGDAPIKSLALSLFIPRERVHHFKDIGYQHKFYKQE